MHARHPGGELDAAPRPEPMQHVFHPHRVFKVRVLLAANISIIDFPKSFGDLTFLRLREPLGV